MRARVLCVPGGGGDQTEGERAISDLAPAQADVGGDGTGLDPRLLRHVCHLRERRLHNSETNESLKNQLHTHLECTFASAEADLALHRLHLSQEIQQQSRLARTHLIG